MIDIFSNCKLHRGNYKVIRNLDAFSFPENVITAKKDMIVTFDSIHAHYLGLKQCLMSDIHPGSKPLLPKIIWSFQLYKERLIY
jgi:hypothetical protein